MTETPIRLTDIETETQIDVFAAARVLDDLWNSSAKAVSIDLIDWQCNTWGSGRGRCYWVDCAVFMVVSAALRLQTRRNWDARDELIVSVPLDRFAEVARLVDGLSNDEPEGWPWFDEDLDMLAQVAVAAEVLGLSTEEVLGNEDLLAAFRLDG